MLVKWQRMAEIFGKEPQSRMAKNFWQKDGKVVVLLVLCYVGIMLSPERCPSTSSPASLVLFHGDVQPLVLLTSAIQTPHSLSFVCLSSDYPSLRACDSASFDNVLATSLTVLREDRESALLCFAPSYRKFNFVIILPESWQA
jgi:hypothetical protein